MAEIEKDHWWFKGRRTIFRYLLRGLKLPENTRILEIGCGTGGNLTMLKEFGQVSAVELDEFSRKYASQVAGIEVKYGRLPGELPFADEKFDLICLFDVLEHVEQDAEALEVLKTRLDKGGLILATVPATKWLYGDHDKIFHHFRRYSRHELKEKMRESGMRPLLLGYFNTFLFPLALVARLADLVFFRGNSVGMNIPAGPVNKLLYGIFVSERPILKRAIFPFGLSLICISAID